MSVDLIKAEIFRFLKSSDPEVLCIRGDWGVGKTFAWRKFLGEAESSRFLSLDRYSYVSLFGLSSLEELRYAIFESTVTTGQFLTGPDTGTLRALLEKGEDLTRKGRHLYDGFLSFLGLKDAGDALSRAAFLLVRSQLICLDDLERAGSSLEMRDMLGLASFLKEQRKCKVVLLFNLVQMDEPNQSEFNRLLEKVVDVSLHFDPTPDEAAAIAIGDDVPLGAVLRARVIELGITNIRVIKKIERLALQLADMLAEFRAEVIEQAVATVSLAGWSHFQPNSAPSLDFIRNHNRIRASIRGEQAELTADEKRWQKLLGNYPFTSADDLDLAIIDGVVAGYFNESRLREEAVKVQSHIEQNSRNNSFSEAWDLFHHSLTIPDNVVLDALYNGAMENLGTVSALNIDGTVRFLREFGRNQQASSLAGAYVEAHKGDPNFFDRRRHIWSDNPMDAELARLFDEQYANGVDDRNPLDVLLGIFHGKGWSQEDEKLLAKQTPDDFVGLFEGVTGPDLRRVIETALMLGDRNKEDGRAIYAAASEALRRIAAKSPLSARRVARYGIRSQADIAEDSASSE